MAALTEASVPNNVSSFIINALTGVDTSANTFHPEQVLSLVNAYQKGVSNLANAFYIIAKLKTHFKQESHKTLTHQGQPTCLQFP